MLEKNPEKMWKKKTKKPKETWKRTYGSLEKNLKKPEGEQQFIVLNKCIVDFSRSLDSFKPEL